MGKWQRRTQLPIDDQLAISYLQGWDRDRPWRITESGDREPAPYPSHDEAVDLVRLSRRNVLGDVLKDSGRWQQRGR